MTCLTQIEKSYQLHPDIAEIQGLRSLGHTPTFSWTKKFFARYSGPRTRRASKQNSCRILHTIESDPPNSLPTTRYSAEDPRKYNAIGSFFSWPYPLSLIL